MRLAHKRKVQSKLQKRIKALVTTVGQQPVEAKPEKAVKAKPEKAVKAQTMIKAKQPAVALTAKQQQVLDIVVQHAQGINSKSIGLAAGQEDAKAAAWATGALKKLVELELVEKVQLDGNKVMYKIQ